MRKFIVAIVLFLAVIFIFLSLSELQNIADILHKSNWIFLSIAFFLSVCGYITHPPHLERYIAWSD